jgi:hypothetical protein
MKAVTRLTLAPLLSALVVAQPLLALNYPLTDTAIREAFLTGNANNDRTTEFLLKYAHSLPVPEKGPHVAIISLRTPYEQVAERGATAANIHAQEAEQEFLGKPMPFLIRVQIDFTPTYPVDPAQSPNAAQALYQPLPDFQRDFEVDVIQDKKIVPKSTRTYLLYSGASFNIWGTSGVIIEQEYDPEKIDSSPMTVRVATPDGQDVQTTFDLARLL